MTNASTRARGGAANNSDLGKPRFTKAYGFAIVTGIFFILPWTGHFFAQMVAVRNDAHQHGQSFEWGDFLPQFFSSTLENWQSEFSSSSGKRSG